MRCRGISGSPTGMREPQSAPSGTAASGHGASGSHFPAHHHGDFSSTRNPECPVCREMGRYADELPDADSDGGAVILSRHDPDLRVWTDSSYVPAG